MAYRGKYQPVNRHKYIGDPSKIVWRSTYELKMFKYCDLTDTVLNWASEEVVIPYKSPIDGRMHRYFVDIYMKFKTPDGDIREKIIEIKPAKYTRQPKPQKRRTRQYLMEVEKWAVNQAKWKAATEWAKQKNMTFSVFTEKELGIK